MKPSRAASKEGCSTIWLMPIVTVSASSSPEEPHADSASVSTAATAANPTRLFIEVPFVCAPLGQQRPVVYGVCAAELFKFIDQILHRQCRRTLSVELGNESAPVHHQQPVAQVD